MHGKARIYGAARLGKARQGWGKARILSTNQTDQL
jgi:hypothetical protein